MQTVVRVFGPIVDDPFVGEIRIRVEHGHLVGVDIGVDKDCSPREITEIESRIRLAKCLGRVRGRQTN